MPLAQDALPHKGVSASDVKAVEKNNLNVINGCFVPCLLNILGAVLYLRIGFGVGHMGMFGCMMIFIFSEGIAYLTTSSFSAIVTNGEMKGGGAYYMISRNLGPAFGASSGLLFWFTYSITVTFNAVAFTETFLDTFFPDHNGTQASIACSSITLFILFLVAYKGAGTFAQINVFIFVCLVVSLVTGIGSIYFIFPSSHAGCEDGPYPNEPCHIMKGDKYTHDGVEYYDGKGYFYSMSIQRMKDNMWPNPVISNQCNDQKCSLNTVFGVIFPAITGMMEGCNLSGDLKDPSYAIPTGTVAAISVAFIMYLLIIVGNAASMDRKAMQYDMFVMQHACVSQYLVVLGVAAACLSTSLGSLFGSSRILQAIARDDIIPILAPFKKGTAKGDEPRNAVILTYIIAQCGVFIGGLDQVGPVLTNFYLIVYALVNFATVLLELADLPNFRPPFKYYSWQTSLLGSVLTLVTMFYMQPVFGLITVLIVLVLFLYIMRYGKQKPWGDISQAILFNQARSFLLRLQEGITSTKFWQPSLLLISDDFEAEHVLVHFCNDLKRGGVLCFGQALLGNDIHEIHEAQAKAAWRNNGDSTMPSAQVTSIAGNSDGSRPGHSKGTLSTSMTTANSPRSSYGLNSSSRLQRPNTSKQRVWAIEQRDTLAELITTMKVDAFPQVMVATTARVAYQNLILSAGMGTMVPDTVVMPMLPSSKSDERSFSQTLPVKDGQEYVHMLRDVLDMNKNLIIAGNFGCSPTSDPGTNTWQEMFLAPGKTPTIDLWIYTHPTAEDTDLREDIDVSLAMQLSYVLLRTYKRYRPKLRVIQMLATNRGGVSNAGRSFEATADGYPDDGDDLEGDLEENLLDVNELDAMKECAEAKLRALLKACRIEATALCVPYEAERGNGQAWDKGEEEVSIALLNKFAREISADTKLLFMTLPPLPPAESSNEAQDLSYLSGLAELVAGLPPVALTANGQGFSVITTEI